MKIARRASFQAYIPTASTSDIAFLLILFFMVTTVFRTEKGLKIELPQAKATERLLKRKHATNIWVSRDGKISIDDKLITLNQVQFKISEKLRDDPDLVVLIRSDKKVRYGIINDILEKLKDARAFKVVFSTEFER